MGRYDYACFLHVSGEVAHVTHFCLHVSGEVAQIAVVFCMFLVRWPRLHVTCLTGVQGEGNWSLIQAMTTSTVLTRPRSVEMTSPSNETPQVAEHDGFHRGQAWNGIAQVCANTPTATMGRRIELIDAPFACVVAFLSSALVVRSGPCQQRLVGPEVHMISVQLQPCSFALCLATSRFH